MLELFGEVGGDVPEYFSSGKRCLKNDSVKSYRKKIVLKTFQLEFRYIGFKMFDAVF